MESGSSKRGLVFWFATAIILATILIVAVIFLRLWRLPFVIIDIMGIRNSITHWMGWAGSLYILLVTPLYILVKRRIHLYIRGFLRAHAIGNLLAIVPISIHFTHQLTRSPTNYPDLGTGVVQYASIILLMSSGFMIYFGLASQRARQLRFLHPAMAITLFLSIVLHIIHGI